jgi:cell division protein FtsB
VTLTRCRWLARRAWQNGPVSERRPLRRTTVDKPSRAASNEGRSRLGDLTRPVAREHAITRRWSSNLMLGLVATTIAVALAVTLFVLPVRTWFDQTDEIDQRRQQLEQLESVNGDLQAEVDRLETDAGIREAAREEVGVVDTNEQRRTMLEYPLLPERLPKGYPYSVVTGIVDVRSQP